MTKRTTLTKRDVAESILEDATALGQLIADAQMNHGAPPLNWGAETLDELVNPIELWAKRTAKPKKKAVKTRRR